jgi:hypothetical protein
MEERLRTHLDTLLARLGRETMAPHDVREAIKALAPSPRERREAYRHLRTALASSDSPEAKRALYSVPPDDDWEVDEGRFVPGVPSIIRRALCVGALFYQGVQETVAQEAPSEENIAVAKAHLAWVRENLWDDLTKAERAVLSTDVGAWRDEMLGAAFARAEVLGVLAWALSLVRKIPRYDEEFDGGVLAEAYEALRLSTAKPVLRERWQLRRANTEASRWHRRACVEPGAPHAATSFEGMLPRKPSDDLEVTATDFILFRKLYIHLTDDERERAHAIATGRHLAASWLCGQTTDWDEPPSPHR